MIDHRSSLERLKALLVTRIMVLDGAMGTAVQELALEPEDFGGTAFDGCNEHLVRTRPDIIRRLHRSFLAAGADLIETNSFGASSVVLAEYGLASEARELNRLAAVIAREEADAFSTDEWPRFVAGAMGPTTTSISLTGGISFARLVDAYREQAEGLIDGGVDLLLLETVQDTLGAKAALVGIEQAIAASGAAVGVALQGTVEAMGTLLAGQDVEALYVSLAHRDLLWMGLNCAGGPSFMTDHLRGLARISRFPVACAPNAGLPDEDGRYHETPAMFAAKLEEFMAQGLLNLAGGCCGTTPEHIRMLAEAARRYRPRRAPATTHQTAVSGTDVLIIDAQGGPVIAGERTNALGSRRFARLIREEKYEEAAEVGRSQIRCGAQLLDVCLQDPDHDEGCDLSRYLEVLVRKVKAPIVIDSTDPEAIELALQRLPGKAIINSVNLEDGPNGERLVKVAELARRYGAALIVGCIDEDRQQAQALTRGRKLAIAQRAYELLTGRMGIAAEDILFDPLVFPLATGAPEYAGSGIETIEGIRAIKAALPRCKTILGISNVSFGLPEAGRQALNSVMLHHCARAGLDVAIINPQGLPRYQSIPEGERTAAEDLIWGRGADPIAAFAALFRARPAKPASNRADLRPLDERLASNVLEGSREGLHSDLDLALQTNPPLEIIAGPLMHGMDEVGRLFGAGRLIVAEVLQSAEVMKAAVAHLQPYLDRDESTHRGTIVLATVKGDVHDIGKNLVDIIFTNNGYRVINLGIKVAPERLIAACREHRPDLIGLSGLLVKSAHMMVETARELAAAGISSPLLVGGAALTERFTRTKIAPQYGGLVAYAADAMSGLALANQLIDPSRREQLAARLAQESARTARPARPAPAPTAVIRAAHAAIRHDVDIPLPPDLARHVLADYDLSEIFSYINPVMLYTRHLGLRDARAALAGGDPRAMELKRIVGEVEDIMAACKDIRAGAVFKFFRANSDGRTLLIYDPGASRPLARLIFGRQSDPPYLCLADYVAPCWSGRTDYVCMFATTIGPGVRALAERWKDDGEYLRSHVLQALSLEGAEAFAELLHRRIRRMWGFADPPELGLEDLFAARYRGRRYSFGYPACPRLEDQEVLFRLLQPDRTIGVHLTEGFMMDPEGSVSALIVHHPDARYFALSQADSDRLAKEIEAPEHGHSQVA